MLKQNFKVNAPNRAWVSDITYVRTAQGWSYLAIVIDLYSRRVVGWAMDTHMRADLVAKATQRAIETRNPSAGLVFHSDRGSQYASDAFRTLLKQNGIVQSMSRAGDCYDNAPAESFFATIKKERLSRRAFATHTEAYDAVAKFIDGFYNPTRRHSALGYLSPIHFENHTRANAA